MRFFEKKLFICCTVSIISCISVDASNLKHNGYAPICCYYDYSNSGSNTLDVINNLKYYNPKKSIHTIKYDRRCRDMDNSYDNYLFLERVDIKRPKVNRYKHKIYLDNNIMLNANNEKNKCNKTEDNINDITKQKLKLLGKKTYLKNPNIKAQNNTLNTNTIQEYTPRDNTIQDIQKVIIDTLKVPNKLNNIPSNTTKNFYATVKKCNSRNNKKNILLDNVNKTVDIPRVTIDISKSPDKINNEPSQTTNNFYSKSKKYTSRNNKTNDKLNNVLNDTNKTTDIPVVTIDLLKVSNGINNIPIKAINNFYTNKEKYKSKDNKTNSKNNNMLNNKNKTINIPELIRDIQTVVDKINNIPNNTANNFYHKTKQYNSRNDKNDDVLDNKNKTIDVKGITYDNVVNNIPNNTTNNFYHKTKQYNSRNDKNDDVLDNKNKTIDVKKLTHNDIKKVVSKKTNIPVKTSRAIKNNSRNDYKININDNNNTPSYYNTIDVPSSNPIIHDIKKCDIKPIIVKTNTKNNFIKNKNVRNKIVSITKQVAGHNRVNTFVNNDININDNQNKHKVPLDNTKTKKVNITKKIASYNRVNTFANNEIKINANQNKEKFPFDNTKTKIVKVTSKKKNLNNTKQNKYIAKKTNTKQNYLPNKNNLTKDNKRNNYNNNSFNTNYNPDFINYNQRRRNEINNLIRNLHPNPNNNFNNIENNLYTNGNNYENSLFSSFYSSIYIPSLSKSTIILDINE